MTAGSIEPADGADHVQRGQDAEDGVAPSPAFGPGLPLGGTPLPADHISDLA